MNIFIVGYYGFQNAGDERLLNRTIVLLKDRYPKANLCVLTHPNLDIKGENKPFCSSQLLGELTYCSRRSLRQVLRALSKSDQIVFGGGSLFQDVTSFRSLLYYSVFLAMGIFLRKKTILLAQGIGPLLRKRSQRIVRFLFNRASLLSVRDQESLSFLKQIGVRKHIHLTADLAYYKAVIKQDESDQKPPLVGLALRQFPLAEDRRNLLIEFLKKNTQDFIFLNCQTHVDFQFLQPFPEVQEKVVETVNVLHLFQAVSKTALDRYRVFAVVSMRYHGCVWASLNGIPFLALCTDDPKLKNLAEKLGQPWLDLTNPNLQLSDLVAAYNSLMKQYPHYQEKLISQTNALIADSERTAALV